MTIYEQHLEIKQQLEALESRKRELENKMIEEITEQGEPTRLPWGTYSTMRRTNYVFSDEVQETQKSIKQRVKDLEATLSVDLEKKKKKEIEEGIARESVTTSIRFVADKDKAFDLQFK